MFSFYVLPYFDPSVYQAFTEANGSIDVQERTWSKTIYSGYKNTVRSRTKVESRECYVSPCFCGAVHRLNFGISLEIDAGPEDYCVSCASIMLKNKTVRQRDRSRSRDVFIGVYRCPTVLRKQTDILKFGVSPGRREEAEPRLFHGVCHVNRVCNQDRSRTKDSHGWHYLPTRLKYCRTEGQQIQESIVPIFSRGVYYGGKRID